MHGIVEKAADAGDAKAGGFRLQVQNLPQQTGFPEQFPVRPRLALERTGELGQNADREAGIGGNILMAGNDPRGAPAKRRKGSGWLAQSSPPGSGA